MNKQPTSLHFESGDSFIRLFSEKTEVNGSVILPGENTYTIEHNIYAEPSREGLGFIQAIIIFTGLLAELVEDYSNDSGSYPYSKEQFAMLLSHYLQPDALKLSEVFSELINEESKIVAQYNLKNKY